MSSAIPKAHGVKSTPSVIGFLATGEEVKFSGEAKMEAIDSWLRKLEDRSRSSIRLSTGQGLASAKNAPLLSKLTHGEVCGSHVTVCLLAVVKSERGMQQARRALDEVQFLSPLQCGLF